MSEDAARAGRSMTEFLNPENLAGEDWDQEMPDQFEFATQVIQISRKEYKRTELGRCENVEHLIDTMLAVGCYDQSVFEFVRKAFPMWLKYHPVSGVACHPQLQKLQEELVNYWLTPEKPVPSPSPEKESAPGPWSATNPPVPPSEVAAFSTRIPTPPPESLDPLLQRSPSPVPLSPPPQDNVIYLKASRCCTTTVNGLPSDDSEWHVISRIVVNGHELPNHAPLENIEVRRKNTFNVLVLQPMSATISFVRDQYKTVSEPRLAYQQLGCQIGGQKFWLTPLMQVRSKDSCFECSKAIQIDLSTKKITSTSTNRSKKRKRSKKQKHEDPDAGNSGDGTGRGFPPPEDKGDKDPADPSSPEKEDGSRNRYNGGKGWTNNAANQADDQSEPDTDHEEGSQPAPPKNIQQLMSITLKNKQTGSPIPSTKPVPGGLNVDLHITNTSSQDLSLKCVVMGAERTLLPVASAELQAGETRCIGSFTTPEGERRVVVKCLMQQEEQYFQSHCVIPVWVLTPNYECMQTHLQAKINALSKEEKAQLEEKNKLEDELRKRIEITEEMAIEKECLRKEREQLFAEKEKLARELNDLQKKMQEVQLTGKECPLSKPAQNLSNIFDTNVAENQPEAKGPKSPRRQVPDSPKPKEMEDKGSTTPSQPSTFSVSAPAEIYRSLRNKQQVLKSEASTPSASPPTTPPQPASTHSTSPLPASPASPSASTPPPTMSIFRQLQAAQVQMQKSRSLGESTSSPSVARRLEDFVWVDTSQMVKTRNMSVGGTGADEMRVLEETLLMKEKTIQRELETGEAKEKEMWRALKKIGLPRLCPEVKASRSSIIRRSSFIPPSQILQSASEVSKQRRKVLIQESKRLDKRWERIKMIKYYQQVVNDLIAARTALKEADKRNSALVEELTQLREVNNKPTSEVSSELFSPMSVGSADPIIIAIKNTLNIHYDCLREQVVSDSEAVSQHLQKCY